MRIFEVGIDRSTTAALRAHGHTVLTDSAATSPDDLISWVDSGSYDAVLLNLDQFRWANEAAQRMRRAGRTLVIVGVSQGHGLDPWHEQRAIFLEHGGDDCIRSPVHMRELLATLSAAGRRDKTRLGDVRIFRYGEVEITLNLTHRSVTVNGTPLRVTKREFDLFETLGRNPGHLKSRDVLIEIISANDDMTDRTVDTHIKRLRNRLRSVHPQAGDIIQTVYGGGYRIPDAYAAHRTSTTH